MSSSIVQIRQIQMAAGIYKHQNSEISPIQAVEKIEEIIKSAQVNKTQLDWNFGYLHSLIEKDIKNFEFSNAKIAVRNFPVFVSVYAGYSDQLKLLKFDPEEMFDMFSGNDGQTLLRISKVGARMQIFVSQLSQQM